MSATFWLRYSLLRNVRTTVPYDGVSVCYTQTAEARGGNRPRLRFLAKIVKTAPSTHTQQQPKAHVAYADSPPLWLVCHSHHGRGITMSDETPTAASWIFRFFLSWLTPVLRVWAFHPQYVCAVGIELLRVEIKEALYVPEGWVCPPAYTVPATDASALAPSSPPTMW